MYPNFKLIGSIFDIQFFKKNRLHNNNENIKLEKTGTSLGQG